MTAALPPNGSLLHKHAGVTKGGRALAGRGCEVGLNLLLGTADMDANAATTTCSRGCVKLNAALLTADAKRGAMVHADAESVLPL